MIGSRTGRWNIIAIATTGFVLLLGGWAAKHLFRAPAADDARSHWQEAQKEIAERHFVDAADHLLLCLESWPLNAEAHFVTARTARRAGQLGPWQVHLERAEVLGWSKQQIYLERLLRKAQVGDVWDVETPLIDFLNTKPPEEVVILEALVDGFMVSDRLIDVIAFTTAWSERYPEDWLPHMLRGNAVSRLYAKSGEAVKDFERALTLRPNEPDAHLSLALALTNQGDFDEAIPHFQAYLSSRPENPVDALFALATCQFSLGRNDQAHASLEKLFAVNPDHPTACFLRAKIELAEGHQEEGFRWLQKAEALSPDEVDVTNALVNVSRHLSRLEDADRYQRRLEEIHRRNDKLEQLLTQLKAQPDDLEIRYQLGVICLEEGRDQQASHWFQAILYKDPNHLPTLRTLVEYYEKKGNAKMANHYRQKIQKATGQAPGKSPKAVKK
jgi:tetratricopeptide (TPR) repeat protein